MVTVKEVITKKENRLFLSFPDRLYRKSPYYVPGLRSDDSSDWNEKKNPAFCYCEVKRFLAYKDGRPAGRIGAILSRRANEKWGERRMRFTAVDFIDDIEVSSALFEAVEAFAKEKECVAVHGPLGFTDLDREGMLIEGFEEKGLFFTYYNAPYYKEHLERLGYEKDVDWVEMKLFRPAEKGGREGAMLSRLSAHVAKKHALKVAPIRKKSDFKPYIEKAFSLVNVAYRELYGTVALDEAQIKRYASKFVPLIDPDFACIILNEAGEMVGFGASAPCLSDAFRRSGGRLFPFGWIPMLHTLRHPKTLDLLLIAVLPEWQGKGVNAMIINHILSNAWRRGVTAAETGPQLEENTKVTSQWSAFSPKQHKRRRCFVKKID
jgi:GNAT superfamily N-acetyltransferase